MKRLHWLSLLILGMLFLTPAWAQSDTNSSGVPRVGEQKTQAKKHKRHRHHKSAHKGHIDRDRYPQG